MNLEAMIQLAAQAHAGQTDRAGLPYILHPLKVMDITKSYFGYNEDLLMMAVGHDLIEDTEVTADFLKEQGFSDRVVAGIVALSKDESKTYDDYRAQVKRNPDAVKVKYADLAHNTDLSRLPRVTPADHARTAKYAAFQLELVHLSGL